MLTCSDTASSSKQYLELVGQKAIRNRIPMSGSIDLTHRCNLNCIHCYLGDKIRADRLAERELPARRWCAVLDELADAGCLYLLFSGGEPLIRDDFGDIYTHAKKCGMLVTVFTNGTTITDGIVDLFRDYPPFAVEISIYGASERTCERITGRKDALARCLKGIEMLLAAGIRVSLKTVLMNQNRAELTAIGRIAENLGVDFRFDAAIFSGLNGEPLPQGIRVDPEAAVALELADAKRLGQWRRYFLRMQGEPVSDRLYRCGAGETNFYIDPYGFLTPCLMVTNPRYDLGAGSFLTGWHGEIAKIRERKTGDEFVCRTCEKRSLCEICPAFFRVETGSEQIRSEYICAMGRHRYRTVVASMDSKGD
ncbi:MAG: radical SAM protein [Desulfobacterales bacterium]|nr:radical SAM protein [Desulfobacterales bacterium]